VVKGSKRKYYWACSAGTGGAFHPDAENCRARSRAVYDDPKAAMAAGAKHARKCYCSKQHGVSLSTDWEASKVKVVKLQCACGAEADGHSYVFCSLPLGHRGKHRFVIEWSQ